MTDAYADPQAQTETVPAVRLGELGKRDAFMARLERIRDHRALASANERFDGVDRRLTGDPVPGHRDVLDVLPMVIALIVIASGLAGFVIGVAL